MAARHGTSPVQIEKKSPRQAEQRRGMCGRKRRSPTRYAGVAERLAIVILVQRSMRGCHGLRMVLSKEGIAFRPK